MILMNRIGKLTARGVCRVNLRIFVQSQWKGLDQDTKQGDIPFIVLLE